ncbi:hypothetical protein QEZ52_18225 [Aliisedimentitalea scapharcae]|uniref:Uncharacterized protein n=1 Tax=Aliisedimentitalea scapharcae TaxID=1524259 RepID=A0ABZ2XRL9_9RHOB|nr:hypothetical protein K3727_18605 [Rhodobacteraceae bacterium M382]
MRGLLTVFSAAVALGAGQGMAEQSWNTVEGMSSAKLAVAGADLVGSSIGQTERGEVIMTHWRVVEGQMAGSYFRCFEVKRYQDKIDVAYCQRAQ